jgi:hypothetical protein
MSGAYLNHPARFRLPPPLMEGMRLCGGLFPSCGGVRRRWGVMILDSSVDRLLFSLNRYEN